MIGKILSNRYQLCAELGTGGMAWVYLAEDLREERQVAVKVLFPQLSQDLGFLQRFIQEAKLAMSLSHSAPEMHVARVLDYGSDQDTHYLVMEFVEGRDLRRVLDQDGPLTWREALDVARQVALALGHASQHGIVHRDIKPENIMLLPDGTIRVLDFGVARARTSPSLTRSGFVGSPYYAAPEQAMGRRVDVRADLYSLGIVLYEILTGQRPFQSDTPWAVVNQQIASPPPSLVETRPDLPKAVARLVRKALSKRPEDRFQTPAEMIRAIEAVLAGQDLPLASFAPTGEGMAPTLVGLYQRAQEAASKEAWREAVDFYSQILRFDPRYRDVTERLAEAGRQARLDALYAAAQQAIQADHWAEALSQLDQIAEVAPDYRDVRTLRAQARRQHELDLLYRRGARHLKAGEWAAAVEHLAQVCGRDPDHEAARLLDTARAELAKEKAAQNAAPHREPPIPGAQAGNRQHRSLVWAIVAILLAVLAFESTLFYRAQQPPAAAAVPATPTVPAPAATDTRTALPTASPSLLPSATGTRPAPTPTQTLARSATATRPKPSRTFTATATPTATSSPTLAETLTPTVKAATSPPPLSGQIAFPRFDPERGVYDVYVCRVDGADCRRVAAQASQPDFLPDGSRLVVHSWQPDDKGLFLITLAGERVWRITDQIEAARPSVDFQGKTYVFHSRQEGDRQPRLYRTYGAEVRPFKSGASAVPGLSPSWLPDGRILYSGCWQDACGILAMRADGTSPQQIVAGGNETNPEASPDGQRVAFMSRRDGNWEIYLVNLDDGGLQRLTHSPANDGLPAWSPDGHSLAFASDRDGTWAVWVVRADGSDLRRLFDIGGPLDGLVLGAALHETHGWVEERITWAPLP